MPELPEVEVMTEVLARRAVNRTITSSRAYPPGMLKTVDPPVEALIGSAFTRVQRRGKHLVLTCSDRLHVVVHLRVAGRLVWSRTDAKITKATGFVIRFGDQEELRVIENATRRRARVYVVRDPEDVPSVASLGVEPLSEGFTVAFLERSFAGLRRQAKKALTDQRLIAGIGSAYADEILFAAKLSPIRYVSTMDREEIARLHRATGAVLREAIDAIRARSTGNPVVGHARGALRVYQRTGHPCPDCGTSIVEIRYAQTQTYYCPHCQSGGRILADRRGWLTR